MKLKTIFRLLVLSVVTNGFSAVVNESSSSQSLPMVHLKSEHEITINSELIKLSDLFVGIQPVDDRTIGNAPDPGKPLKLYTRDIRKLARQSRLMWRPILNRKPLIITRASHVFPLVDLRKVISRALQNKYINDETEIEFSNPRLKIYLPEEVEATVQVHELSYNDETRQFQAVIVTGWAKRTSKITVRGRAYPVIAMPVLKKHLGAGTIIQAKDIGWRKFRTDKSTFDTIAAIDGLIDQVSKRPLIAGRLIRASDIRPQRLVRKGDFVTVHFKNRAMSLSTRGISIEAGTRNQIIKIRNPRSKKIIEARVVGPSVAIVQAPTHLLSSN